MSPSRIFILRPVATSLLMVAILLAGAVGFKQLPVSALPEVDYPTIQVITFYPGASPDVMASSVTAPLERQFGQVPGLQQMTSTSSNGSSIITLQFNLNLNIDVAEQEVQESINAAGTYLPPDLPTPPIYSKSNPADAPVLTLALSSDTLPLSKVEDLADTRLTPKISQLPGVGLVSISGGQKPAVRIRANPTLMASYGINLEDLRNAIVAANVNQAKGSFDGPHQNYQIGANDQLLSSADYRPLIVAYRNGSPVKMTDVATVEDDVENVRQAAWMNETPAVIVNIQRQPGANVIAVVDRIKTLLDQLTKSLPSSVKVRILTDRTTTIRASVHDVEFELMLTVALVVMVIFLFLRNLAATVIPSVAVPALPGGYLRGDVSARLQPEQPELDGPDHFHRIRGGRRHRDDREHHALYRRRRAAAPGGAQRVRADWLHHCFADHLLDCGAHSALVHGRHCRAAFPRVCRHAGGHHPGFRHRVFDAHAHDVLEAAQAFPGSRSDPFLSGHRAGLEGHHFLL